MKRVILTIFITIFVLFTPSLIVPIHKGTDFNTYSDSSVTLMYVWACVLGALVALGSWVVAGWFTSGDDEN